MSYKINHEKFVILAKDVNNKIEECFPNRGISTAARKVHKVCLKAALESKHIKKQNWWLRSAIVSVLILVGFLVFMLVKNIVIKLPLPLSDFIQTLEASISTIIYSSAGLVILLSWEKRLKRNKALNRLNELRSLAHLIDIHQIHKDPDLIISGKLVHSAGDPMTPKELSSYFDYCTELLTLLGKVATIYVQDDNDPQTITAANEIESLSNAMATKIWQKSMLLHQLVPNLSKK